MQLFILILNSEQKTPPKVCYEKQIGFKAINEKGITKNGSNILIISKNL